VRRALAAASAVPVGNVFSCGDDLNATYYGDEVYLVEFDGGTATGEGNGLPVWLAAPHPHQGWWVGIGADQGDTRLVDAYASCGFGVGHPVYVYVQKCKTNGCVVAEDTTAPSLLFWSYNNEVENS
jgi:hypothetical protein